MAKPELPCLNCVLLVEGLTTYLISISQLCDQGFKVIFNKGECVITTKEHEELIKGSRSKENHSLWISKSTSCVTFNDEKKSYVKKASSNIPKELMYDTMLNYPA